MERAKSLAVFGLGFLVTLLAFYPGLMTYDSNVQYQQALELSFVDIHPTVMALVWAVLARLVEGPVLMLVLHAAMFWFGAYLFMNHVQRSSRSVANLLVLLVLLPTTFAIIGVIWKDVGLMGATVLLLGLVIGVARREGRIGVGYKAALILLVYYIVNIRHNSMLAAVPLVIIALRYLAPERRLVRHATIAVAIVAALFLTHKFVDGFVLQTEKKATEFQLVRLSAFDVAGIQAHGGEVVVDAFSDRPCRMEESYRDANLDGLRFAFAAERNLKAAGMGELSDFLSLWLRTVRDNPYEYLAHRLYNFNRALRFGVDNDTDYVLPNDRISRIPVDHGFEFDQHNALFRVLNRYAGVFKDTVLFKGWIYLLVNLLMLGACVAVWRSKKPLDFNSELALAMSAYSVLYLLPYLLIAYVLNWRLLYPAVMVTTLSVPVYLVSSVHRDVLDRAETVALRLRDLLRALRGR